MSLPFGLELVITSAPASADFNSKSRAEKGDRDARSTITRNKKRRRVEDRQKRKQVRERQESDDPLRDCGLLAKLARICRGSGVPMAYNIANKWRP